jgi:xylulokinase
MGVTLAAGGSLRWVRDMLGGPEREVASWTGDEVYALFAREASLAEPGSEGLLFLPYLIGERCPYPDPQARGAFVGLTLRHNRRHILRSVFEGVVFSLNDVAQIIRGMGLPIHQIRTSGGGALSELWRQIHADVFDGEVITVSGSAEGGAYGAALVAGVGAGVWQTVEHAANVVKTETTNRPVQANVDVYRKLFRIYTQLYGALKHSFDEIAGL